MKSKAKLILKIIGRLITLLSLVYVVVAALKLGIDFSSFHNLPALLLFMLLGGVLVALGVSLQGMAWLTWVTFFTGKAADRVEGLCVYCKANIGKYLPGNVMHYVERNLFAEKMGAAQSMIALSSVFEVGTQVCAALVLAVILAGPRFLQVLEGVLPAKIWEYRIPLLLGLVAAGIAFLALIYFIFLRKKAGDLLSKENIGAFLLSFLRAGILYMVVMLIGGVIMLALYGFMGGSIDADKSILIIAGYVIAWVLGFVVPGAPGGVGVREFVLTFMLNGVVETDLLMTLIVVHRFITIIGDFMAYLVQFAVQRYKAAKE